MNRYLIDGKEIIDKYELNRSDELWWCNSHNRQATYLFTKTINGVLNRQEPCCDPKSSGLLITCSCVKIPN